MSKLGKIVAHKGIRGRHNLVWGSSLTFNLVVVTFLVKTPQIHQL